MGSEKSFLGLELMVLIVSVYCVVRYKLEQDELHFYTY
jgi:hypothetical protein